MPLCEKRHMKKLDWQQYKAEFLSDGSWRDIYVLDADVTIWQRLLDFLRSSNIQHHFGGEDKPEYLNDLGTYFKERGQHGSLILSIDIYGVILNCHFFIESEIEFDLDPKEITDESKAVAVFEFMEMVSEALTLPIRMTPENMDETPIFEYSPGKRAWSYSPFYGKTA